MSTYVVEVEHIGFGDTIRSGCRQGLSALTCTRAFVSSPHRWLRIVRFTGTVSMSDVVDRWAGSRRPDRPGRFHGFLHRPSDMSYPAEISRTSTPGSAIIRRAVIGGGARRILSVIALWYLECLVALGMFAGISTSPTRPIQFIYNDAQLPRPAEPPRTARYTFGSSPEARRVRPPARRYSGCLPLVL